MAHNPRHIPSEFRLSPPWNVNHPLWGAEFRSQTMPFRYDPEDPPEFRRETLPHRIDPGFDRLGSPSRRDSKKKKSTITPIKNSGTSPLINVAGRYGYIDFNDGPKTNRNVPGKMYRFI